jgi:hypothetical protein
MTVLKVRHTGLSKLFLAEKKDIVINTRGSGHPFCYLTTLISIPPVNHRVKVIRPLLLGFSLITVGDFPKLREFFPNLLYSVLRYEPGDHSIGIKSCFLMTQGGSEASDNPSLF